MAVAVLLCGHCGSHMVDVIGWRSSTSAVLRCSSCTHQAPVAGFTVGRVWRADESALIRSAIADAALPLVTR
jgi:hypothetical protein